MIFSHAPIARNATIIFALAGLADVAIIYSWISVHAPLSDDLSMIAFSQSWSTDWLNKGLADYFIVYPEYYEPQSNFIRPVSNFLYWIFSFLIREDAPFLANKVQLIVLNFGTHAAICSCLYVITMRMQAPCMIALGIALIAFAMPPFWTTPAPTYSSFVFDELSVLFCLVAFLAWQSQRAVTMTALLTLAMLTKEISLPIIIGFFVLFVLSKNWRYALAPFSALIIWSALRLHSFGLHAEGLYVFETTNLMVLDILKEKLFNALTLPLGPVFFENLKTADGFYVLHRDGLLLLTNIILLSACSFILLLNISATPAFLTLWMKLPKPAQKMNQSVLLACLIAIFSFLFDAYIGANYRYALNLIPFLALALAGIVNRTKMRTTLILLLVAGSYIASAQALNRLWIGSEFETYRYEIMRNLFSELRAHRGSKMLIIANDFVSGYANPDAYEILAPTPTQILRGTSLYLDSCSIQAIRSIKTSVAPDKDYVNLTASLPDCAKFTFESSPKLLNFIAGTHIKRNNIIEYDFAPDMKWTGRHLTMTSRRADLLYFDFATSKWVFVPSSSQ